MLLPTLIFARSISLEELVDQGLKNNFELKQSDVQQQIAKSQVNSSRWNLLPSVSAELSRTEDLKSDVNSIQKNQLNLNVSKSISLNDGNYFQNKYARHDYEDSKIENTMKKRDFIFQMIKSYIAVLSSQKQLEAQKKNLSIQQNIVEQNTQLFAQKKITSFEVKQGEITLLNIQISIKKLENEIKNKRRSLFDLINADDQDDEFADISYDQNSEIAEFNADHIFELILLQRKIKRDNIAMTQSKLNYFPQLSLNYSYNHSKFDQNLEFSHHGTNHTLSLKANYSLWTYFENYESYRQSSLNKKLSVLNYENKLNTIKTEYSQYADELLYYNDLQNLYSLKKENATENLQIAEEKYQLGKIQQIDLDKARLEKLEAEIEYESNKYQLILSRESINHLMSEKMLNKY